MEGTFESHCDSTSNHYYPALQQLPKTIYICACVVNAISSVTSTFGNTLILLALRKCRSLHSPSKALLCSLALTDLFVDVVVLPLFTAYNSNSSTAFNVGQYRRAVNNMLWINRGGAVASWLERSTPERVVRVRALGDIVLCLMLGGNPTMD